MFTAYRVKIFGGSMKVTTKLMIILTTIGFIACAKENNKLAIKVRPTANVKAGEMDPAVKKRIDSLYNVDALVGFRDELEKASAHGDFDEIKARAKVKFATLIDPRRPQISRAREKIEAAKKTGKKLIFIK